MQISCAYDLVEVGVPVVAVHGVSDGVVVGFLDHSLLVDVVLDGVLHDIGLRFEADHVRQALPHGLLSSCFVALGREWVVETHGEAAWFLDELPPASPDEVRPSLRVVQPGDEGPHFGVLVLEVQQFVFVQPLLGEGHLPVVVSGQFLHVRLVGQCLVVQLLPAFGFLLLHFVLLLQLQLLHVCDLLFLLRLPQFHLLQVLFVIHLALQGAEAILLETADFVLFLGLPLSQQHLVLRAPVLLPVDSLLYFVVVGRLHLLFVQLLSVLEVLVVVVELLFVVVLLLLYLPFVVVTTLQIS